MMIRALAVGCVLFAGCVSKGSKEQTPIPKKRAEIGQSGVSKVASSKPDPFKTDPQAKIKDARGLRKVGVFYANGARKRTWSLVIKTSKRGNKRYLKHGPETLWFPTGQKMELRSFANNKAHGVWKAWYLDGRLRYSHAFFRGKPHGKWIDWYPNGKVMRKGTFKGGMREGVWAMWSQKGRLYWRASFKNGQRR